MTYLTTPNFYAGPGAKARLRDILNRARNPSQSRAVRWVADGDSQETNPSGQGVLNHPLIAHELWKRYGNIPESQIIQRTNIATGIGIRVQHASMDAVGNCALARYPYQMEPLVNPRVDNSVATHGALNLLSANLLNVTGSITDIPRTVEYIKRTGLSLKMLIPCLATQGDTLHYRCSFSTDGVSNFNNADTGSGTVDITAAQVANNAWITATMPYNFGASPPTAANLSTEYPQQIVRSANANQVELGPSWFASGDTSGIAVSSWSAGGVATDEHFTDRPDYQLFMQEYDPDIYSLQCGANDASDGDNKAAYKLAVSDKVDPGIIHEIPDAVILLIPDAPRTGLTAPQLTEYNQYADALYEVAQAFPDSCVFINVQRRLTDSHGWNSDNALTGGFTSDGVHYALPGARLIAQETVRGMFRAAGLEDPAGGRSRGGVGPTGLGSRLSRSR